MITIYNTLLSAGALIGLLFLTVLLSEKRRKTIPARLGLKPLKNFSGQKTIWIHALSVGEVLSAVPLVKKIRGQFPQKKIVFSVSTYTGFKIAETDVKKYTDYILYFPYDFFFCIKKTAEKINPQIVIIIETDIWPNFLAFMKTKNIPVILANARLSKKSFSGYNLFSFFTKPVFNIFSHICVQSQTDAKRFSHLGIPSKKITITGNIKFDQNYPDFSDQNIKDMRSLLNIAEDRKIFIAGSTHEGEEEIIIRSFAKLRKTFQNILLIIAPRDPKRSQTVKKLCKQFKVRLFSQLYPMSPKNNSVVWDIIIVDSIGMLRQLYALGNIAFVGGSLVKSGGHNPLEPAAYSKPIIFGSDMSDFKDIAKLLLKSCGAAEIKTSDDIYNFVSSLLIDDSKTQHIGKCAYRVFAENKGAVDSTVKVIPKICKTSLRVKKLAEMSAEKNQ